MWTIQSFCFNPFQENSYVLFTPDKNAIIIDPGCYGTDENEELARFISEENLIPIRLLNTHGHIDHILGNAFVHRKFNLLPELHKDDLYNYDRSIDFSKLYGLPFDPSPTPINWLTEGQIIALDNCKLEVLFTPGHSSGSVSFWCSEQDFIISGDVLFQSSIGRTDLPGGDYDTLIESIKTKLMPLPENTKVYSGHGNPTTVGIEKKINPFLVG